MTLRAKQIFHNISTLDSQALSFARSLSISFSPSPPSPTYYTMSFGSVICGVTLEATLRALLLPSIKLSLPVHPFSWLVVLG